MNEPVEGPRGETHPAAAELPAAFAGFYAEHSRVIYYLTLRYLGDPQKAEDATHDVFLKAFQRFDQFRGEASVRSWLYRIAINHCQNLTRSWHHRHVFANSDDAVWEHSAARTDSPLRLLETKELGQRIQNSLNALSEEYRLLLLLVADQEMSYDEIAAVVGQSTDAVRGKLHRARKSFAAHFEKSM
jgi:RNA polymerase sigma-70 factor (ECF subfamily)